MESRKRGRPKGSGRIGPSWKVSSCKPWYTWVNMHSRCRYILGSSTHSSRGITVCGEWHSPEVFAAWFWEQVDRRPDVPFNSLTLDRIDDNGNYCPENCQLLTRSEHSTKSNHERQ